MYGEENIRVAEVRSIHISFFTNIIWELTAKKNTKEIRKIMTIPPILFTNSFQS